MKDTVSAVRRVVEKDRPEEVAIGSKEAADHHGMVVIERGIETNPRNFTRFVVIGTEPLEKGPYRKSSIVFSAGNRPGSLFDLLKVFADNQINLVKLESRPIHGKPWEYMFYIDLEADVSSDSFGPVNALLESKTEYLKYLGSY